MTDHAQLDLSLFLQLFPLALSAELAIIQAVAQNHRIIAVRGSCTDEPLAIAHPQHPSFAELAMLQAVAPHPHIIAVHASCTRQGPGGRDFYLLTELCSGNI